MDGLKITRKPRFKDPYFIAAWPGMGEVAYRAANYLVEKLKAEEFARLEPEGFFYLTGSIIQDGILGLPELPRGRFFHWKNKAGKNDLIIFLSDAQPDLSGAKAYCEKILLAAKEFGAKMLVGFASMPQPIDHAQQPGVWFAATSAELAAELKKNNLNSLPMGQISGMNGLFLGVAKREGFSGFCLFGEIPLYTVQIENPKAAYVVLNALNKVLDLRLDLAGLVEQAHDMEAEINKLLDYLKLGPQAQAGPIQDDEIDKIKKTLAQLTKLPVSVKEKIEQLFEQNKNDITKAHGLKQELDKWNVYKDYEDRFLDLFKKSKEKNN
jgi:proteasome assembly chaperone (PAC2) family protein